MCDDKSFVRSAALRVYKGPSGAGKTEIPAKWIDVPGGLDIGPFRWHLQRRRFSERVCVGLYECATPFLEPRQLLELVEAQRRLNIRHVALETGAETS